MSYLPEPEARALVERVLHKAEAGMPPGLRLGEGERQEIVQILLAGVDGGETDLHALAAVALALAERPVGG
ncbi:hypothetical protein [Labrys wisconsinensis]|uniref:Uncharacterized protein n=1 Tax=Labrys wisconsinensis TaxID=425677 RepID=A0ABU0JG68_9HYPH|nr:hypothetical protein [Labrys wisconsinensis]MDQ0473285.1 hypothetical protein [Labrys wisconsinensis]